MKYIYSVILLLVVVKCSCQKNFESSSDLRDMSSMPLIYESSNSFGFLFGKQITERILKAKKEHCYMGYWYTEPDVLKSVEEPLQQYLKQKIDSAPSNSMYIRQYFPFITKKGEQKILITLSLVRGFDNDHRLYSRLSEGYRGVYTEGDSYLAVVFDYSNNTF